MSKNHVLLESLEYQGEYNCRYTCKMCVHRAIGIGYQPCEKQGVNVFENNNVCRSFEPRIKNPSAPEFDLDGYLEFLGSDFYRPHSVDTSVVVGKSYGTIGLEITALGGWTSRYGEITQYKPYDQPYCRNFFPRCHVEVIDSEGITRKFMIDYRLYRELSFTHDGEIHFVEHLWKDKPTQRRYNKETNGRWRLNERK